MADLDTIAAELYAVKRRLEALETRVERDEEIFADQMHRAHDVLAIKHPDTPRAKPKDPSEAAAELADADNRPKHR